MRVCRLKGDPDYMSAKCADFEQHKVLLKTDQERRPPDAGACVKLSYMFDEPAAEGVVTDFPYMSPGITLLLSRRALEILRPVLDEAGVILDVEPRHEMDYKLFVCTRVVDALDRERTEFFEDDEGRPTWDPRRYVFRPEALEGVAIFRQQGCLNRLFATDLFFDRMAGQRLTGLMVRPLWSSEHGTLEPIKLPVMPFKRYPPGFGTTLRQKRQAMRDIIAGRR